MTKCTYKVKLRLLLSKDVQFKHCIEVNRLTFLGPRRLSSTVIITKGSARGPYLRFNICPWGHFHWWAYLKATLGLVSWIQAFQYIIPGSISKAKSFLVQHYLNSQFIKNKYHLNHCPLPRCFCLFVLAVCLSPFLSLSA